MPGSHVFTHMVTHRVLCCGLKRIFPVLTCEKQKLEQSALSFAREILSEVKAHNTVVNRTTLTEQDLPSRIFQLEDTVKGGVPFKRNIACVYESVQALTFSNVWNSPSHRQVDLRSS